jgi:hypothetical protein
MQCPCSSGACIESEFGLAPGFYCRQSNTRLERIRAAIDNAHFKVRPNIAIKKDKPIGIIRDPDGESVEVYP